jgi:hypothetical protein
MDLFDIVKFSELASIVLSSLVYVIILLILSFILFASVNKYRKTGELPYIGSPFGPKEGCFSSSLKESTEKLEDAENVQQIAATQLLWLGANYENVLRQSQRSFNFALIAAGISLVFFMSLIAQPTNQTISTTATTLGGALSGFISAVNFHLYYRSTAQLADFHNKLDLTERYLIADSICDKLDKTAKDKVRADVIRKIAEIEIKQDTTIDLDIAKHLDNSENKTPPKS